MRSLAATVLVVVTVACRGESSRDPAPAADPIRSAPSPTVSLPTTPLDRPTRESLAETAAPAASAATPRPNATDRSAVVPARANDSTRAPTAPSAATAATGPATPSASAAAVPSKTPPVTPRRGAAASGPSYEVWLETTGGYSAGSTGSVIVALNAKAPYKCNTQYPYKLALDAPPAGVTYASAVARGMQVEGKHASMPVQFSAASAGSYAIAGTLSFSTCTEDKCLVDKAHIGVTVDVR